MGRIPFGHSLLHTSSAGLSLFVSSISSLSLVAFGVQLVGLVAVTCFILGVVCRSLSCGRSIVGLLLIVKESTRTNGNL